MGGDPHAGPSTPGSESARGTGGAPAHAGGVRAPGARPSPARWILDRVRPALLHLSRGRAATASEGSHRGRVDPFPPERVRSLSGGLSDGAATRRALARSLAAGMDRRGLRSRTSFGLEDSRGGSGRRPDGAGPVAELSFLVPLGACAAILAAAACGGAFAAAALIPPGSMFRPERWGWGFVLGAALIAIEAAVALAPGYAPGWLPALIAFAIAAALAMRFRLRDIGSDIVPERAGSAGLSGLFLFLLASGVLLYLLRALTEPMWSNDYVAIWGLKGKTIFYARRLPGHVLPSSLYGFSHPEYPLGLPLLFAGAASLLRRWDDHALALLFPFFQGATLLALFGWLRRRGVAGPVPLAAAAILSLFEPLYSGFLTGMAEVPLSL